MRDTNHELLRLLPNEMMKFEDIAKELCDQKYTDKSRGAGEYQYDCGLSHESRTWKDSLDVSTI